MLNTSLSIVGKSKYGKEFFKFISKCYFRNTMGATRNYKDKKLVKKGDRYSKYKSNLKDG